MNPIARDAIAGLAMDEAFWARRAAMKKTADAADANAAAQPDDGFMLINGVRIPKSVIYGLALGGLGGLGGGVAGGVDGKTMALLALLGAAAGGGLGYGSHLIDKNTPAAEGSDTNRVDARKANAEAVAKHDEAVKNAGFFTNSANVAMGNPVPDGVATALGVAGQAGLGWHTGSMIQRGLRAHRINELLRTAGPAPDIDPATGRVRTRTRPLIDDITGAAVRDRDGNPRTFDEDIVNRRASHDIDIARELGIPTKDRTPGMFAGLADWSDAVSAEKMKLENPVRKALHDATPDVLHRNGINLVTNAPRVGDFNREGMLTGAIADLRKLPRFNSDVPDVVRTALRENFSSMPRLGRWGSGLKRNAIGGLTGLGAMVGLPTLFGVGPVASAMSSFKAKK